MSLSESLALVVSEPSPAGLWRLRGDLLGGGVPPDAPILCLIGLFHDYLDRIRTGISSRDYSHLASKLDISAISGVILERLAEAGDSQDMAMGILSGALTEGLMVLATRQHVRASSSRFTGRQPGSSMRNCGGGVPGAIPNSHRVSAAPSSRLCWNPP